jgi:glycosyltransferase involved in cell wall biosynthesis
MAELTSLLMTADPLGGALTHAVDLAAELANRGVRVTLATLGGRLSRSQERAAREVKRLTLEQSTFRLEWMDDAWDDVRRSGEWLLAIERRTCPDIVQLSSYAHGALPFVAPRIIVAHSCALSWWEAVTGTPPPPAYDGYRLAVRTGLDGADAVVTPTGTMLRALVEHYGHPARPRIIPGAAPPRLFRPSAKEASIATVGRLWDPAKNIAALGDVAPALSWPIYAAGSNIDLDGKPRRLCGVHPLGELSRLEVASLLSRAAIFALPARYECFGLAVLEAALAGCALVLGDIPELRETWNDTALYVHSDDRQALARALQTLIDEPERRLDLARRARARALARAPERTASAYLTLYAEVRRAQSRSAESSFKPTSSAGASHPAEWT